MTKIKQNANPVSMDMGQPTTKGAIPALGIVKTAKPEISVLNAKTGMP